MQCYVKKFKLERKVLHSYKDIKFDEFMEREKNTPFPQSKLHNNLSFNIYCTINQLLEMELTGFKNIAKSKVLINYLFYFKLK